MTIKNVCRLCLNASERFKMLCLHPTIVEKLSFVGGPLQCGSYAEPPYYICNKCEEDLEFVYQFIVKLKLSKLRISSLYVMAEAERSRNHDTQPFVKDEHSKSDFTDDIQMSEDVQIDGYHDNDGHKDILQMPPIESNSIIDIHKRPILVVDDIDKPLAELESSPRYIINTDQSSFLVDIDKPCGKVETSPFGRNPVIDLDQRPLQVLDDIDKPLAELETSPINYNIDQDRGSITDDIDKSWGKLETSSIGSNSIIDLDQRPTQILDDIDKPLVKLETSPINRSDQSDRLAIPDDIDRPWGNLETSAIGSNSIIDLDQRPILVVDDMDKPLAKLETGPTESNSIISLDKRLIIALNDINKPEVKIETSPTKSKCFIKRSKLEKSEHHSSLDVVTHICHICGKAFGFKSNLVRHIREHEGRRFICTYENCRSFFTQRSSLKLHIAMHKGEKPFLCFLCNKKFTQQKSLQLHLKIHQGEHEHQCSYCKKGFHQKTNFIRHLKIRCFSKTKKFQCVHCEKYFASKQTLSRHNAVHVRKEEILEPITQPCVNPVQVLPINSNTFIFKNE